MKWILGIVFIGRVLLSHTTFNADIYNHIAWMNSVIGEGFRGLYEQDLSPWALPNYPPLTMYAFYVGEKIFQVLPEGVRTDELHAVMYKIPGILADVGVAWLIWRYTTFTKRMKVFMVAVYLLNPALAYNSVFWGQIESFVSFFCILALILFARSRPALGIIAFTIAVLTKQNALPLIPVILYAIWQSRMSLRHFVGALCISVSLFFVSYLPFVPSDSSPVTYPVTSYIASIGGQSHQWQATVNAFNFWYIPGLNQINDAKMVSVFTVRELGILLTVMGIFITIAVAHHYKKDKYVSLFLAASLISLWTFVFATRMHERHNFMMIAYLTLLLPFMKSRIPYYVLSAVSFYNLYAVWQEYFYYNQSVPSWESLTKGLSLITVLIVLAFPLWLLPRDSKRA